MSEVFGTPAQRAMQLRAQALWTLLKSDRRIMCHGRLLSVSFETPDCVDLVLALTQLQGSAGFQNVPNDAVKMVQRPLHAAGLKTDIAKEWNVGANVLRHADTILSSLQLLAGLFLHRVDAQTSPAKLEALSNLAATNGEWLPMGLYLRGQARPSVFLYLSDSEDRSVAMSGCVVHANRFHPREDEGWWGMISVAPEWRGKGLSRHVGAQVLRQMRIDFGTENFTTIVRPDQTGFMNMCRHLGFTSARHSSIYVQDPSGVMNSE
ncbi:MAG: GNAT superfamily N-acetyltransferase [Dinoroseobacter sp.]|jgi:GNAT superfamily N-acetyltransferase